MLNSLHEVIISRVERRHVAIRSSLEGLCARFLVGKVGEIVKVLPRIHHNFRIHLQLPVMIKVVRVGEELKGPDTFGIQGDDLRLLHTSSRAEFRQRGQPCCGILWGRHWTTPRRIGLY